MSSSTTVEATPSVYNVLGQEVLPLDRFLGPGGRLLLLDTLKALPEICESNPAVASQFDWTQVQGQDRFETTVDNTRISLQLSEAFAELSYVDRFEAYESIYKLTAQKLRDKVHMKVNQLLAVTVGRRLMQQVQHPVRFVTADVGAKILRTIAVQFPH